MRNVKEKMAEIVNQVRESRSNKYPPEYEYDDSKYRNSYAHALDIGVEDRQQMGIFYPGMISSYAGNEKIKVINKPFFACYTLQEILDAIISDCEVLGIKAEVVEEKKKSKEGCYKIYLCEDEFAGMWHFVRQSLTEEGKKILTHKSSFSLPSCEVRKNRHCIMNSTRLFIKAVLMISPLED